MDDILGTNLPMTPPRPGTPPSRHQLPARLALAVGRRQSRPPAPVHIGSRRPSAPPAHTRQACTPLAPVSRIHLARFSAPTVPPSPDPLWTHRPPALSLLAAGPRRSPSFSPPGKPPTPALTACTAVRSAMAVLSAPRNVISFSVPVLSLRARHALPKKNHPPGARTNPSRRPLLGYLLVSSC